MEESGDKVIGAKRLTAMNASTVIVNLGLQVETVQCEARLWVRPIATGVFTFTKYKALHHHLILILITPDSTHIKHCCHLEEDGDCIGFPLIGYGSLLIGRQGSCSSQ